jgi:hypothetical protein
MAVHHRRCQVGSPELSTTTKENAITTINTRHGISQTPAIATIRPLTAQELGLAGGGAILMAMLLPAIQK